MSVYLNCTNDKCKKWQMPQLDTKTNIAYCSTCGAEQNLSYFTKTQLKAIGQIRQAVKTAYSVKCQSCKWDALPILKDEQLVCAKCKALCTGISKPFEKLVKEEISKAAHKVNDND